jgi:hypothetical protein
MKIETLALAIQKDFEVVNGRIDKIEAVMATKDDLKSTENRIISTLLSAMKKMDTRLSAALTRNNEDIVALQKSTRDLDVRLRVVEKRG